MIAATGFKPLVTRLPFLDPALAAEGKKLGRNAGLGKDLPDQRPQDCTWSALPRQTRSARHTGLPSEPSSLRGFWPATCAANLRGLCSRQAEAGKRWPAAVVCQPELGLQLTRPAASRAAGWCVVYRLHVSPKDLDPGPRPRPYRLRLGCRSHETPAHCEVKTATCCPRAHARGKKSASSTSVRAKAGLGIRGSSSVSPHGSPWRLRTCRQKRPVAGSSPNMVGSG